MDKIVIIVGAIAVAIGVFLFEVWLAQIIWEVIAAEYGWLILRSYWHYAGIMAIFSGVFHSGQSSIFNKG